MATKRVLCLEIDAKSGKEQYVERDVADNLPPAPQPKGIDQEKLKAILIAQGVITDASEIEV